MHEIIHVVDAATSAVPVRHGLEIEASDQPLPAGYYFVLRPANKRPTRPRAKRYFGPFATRAEARLLMTSAIALGLADCERVRQSIAECRSMLRGELASHNGGPTRPQLPACAAC